MKSNENEENQTSVGITLTSRHEFSSDKDELAWDFYLKYYGEFLFKNEEEKFIFKHGSRKIQVNGDVSFNIVPTSFDGKSRLYESILNETNVSDVLKDSLEVMRYSPMNISILPMKGALNNTKEYLGNDRFDTFAYFMNQYYEGIKVPIINAGAPSMCIENRLELQVFLDSYNTAGEFFEDIYGIDETFVNELIESGKSLITNKEEYCAYIKLAHKYWCYRLNHEKMTNLLDNQKIIQYKDHLNTILKEIEILENSINKK
jgi:hypothetical protein